MQICSIEWVVCILVLSALFFVAPGLRFRQFIFCACSLGFISTLMPGAAAWTALGAFVGFGYAAAMTLRRFPRRALLAGYLAVLLAAFLILKQYSLIKLILPSILFERVIATVGWSYILFRQIQVAVDAAQGQVEALDFWSYLNYQCNGFCFVAGPIQRYQEFCQYWRRLSPILADSESILKAYLRIFIGAIKISFVAGWFFTCFKASSGVLADSTQVANASLLPRLRLFCEVFYSFPLYVYFNFSGYCDMVIAAASLLGLKIPENFDRPYLSRNMIEFWTRWHRTLGFWIRDYIFTPMYKALVGSWPAKAAILGTFCYFAAFFLAGIWHGSTWPYVVYGLLNGLGLAAAKFWETQLVSRIGRSGLRSYLQDRRIRVAATVATLNFACLTMFFFASDLDRELAILKNTFIHRA